MEKNRIGDTLTGVPYDKKLTVRNAWSAYIGLVTDVFYMALKKSTTLEDAEGFTAKWVLYYLHYGGTVYDAYRSAVSDMREWEKKKR